MAFGEREQAGFVLAAVLAGDRTLECCENALDAATLAALRARLAAVPAGEGKARALRELVAQVRPGLTRADTLPARARALIAPLLPREQGRRYVSEAPPARAEFEPSRELIVQLVRIASTHEAP
jgi:hypothetical protein